MPTYDYLCTTCGKQFEFVQSMKDDALTTCLESVCESEQRGKGAVERLISGGGGVIYKGEGFYLTDYVRKGGAEKSTSAAAKETPATTTPETATSDQNTSKQSPASSSSESTAPAASAGAS